VCAAGFRRIELFDEVYSIDSLGIILLAV
jgi:hypothetical protein